MSEGLSRTLVVWCPDWPVTAAGADAATPAVVVEGGLVRACTQAARDAGVRRGQRVRDAQRLCPDLLTRPQDLDAQGRLFERVVAAVERLCPLVEVVRPGVCALAARGPARYFGGEERLAALTRQAVRAAGFACGVGVADGLFAASVAARDGADGVVVPAGGVAAYLAPMPAGVLGRAELARLLTRLGLRTVGEFAALPAGDVLARFGVDGREAHRMARGLAPRPLAPRPPEADWSASMEFDPPCDAREPLVFAAKALADQVHERLAAAGLACGRIEVGTRTLDGRERSRLWRHEGALSGLAVAERVRWQLEAWAGRPDGAGVARAADADPDPGLGGGGVTLLRLTADEVSVVSGRQLALWGRGEASPRVARAAQRVRSMLGHDAVGRVTLAGGRGPAERVERAPWSATPPAESARDGQPPWPGRVPSPSPAVVWAQPAPAVLSGQGGEPVTVDGRCAVSTPPTALAVAGGEPLGVVGWSGPWPVVERWWDRPRARRLARFQVATEDGRAWLLALEGGRWWVEGTYQ